MNAKRFVTFLGVTKSEADWCRIFGLHYRTFRSRLKHGYEPKDALIGLLKRPKQFWLLKHGHTTRRESRRTREYRSWRAMIERCDPRQATKRPSYVGVTVCERWKESFVDFLADMGPRPDGHTLDRIDPTGNYQPDNCRWATTSEQGRNRRNVRWFTILGVSKTIPQWCDDFGINYATVKSRLRCGVPLRQALFQNSTPYASRRHKLPNTNLNRFYETA